MDNFLDKYLEAVEETETICRIGRVKRVSGLIIESLGPEAVIGEVCVLYIRDKELKAEVVALPGGGMVQLMAYGEISGIEIGCRVKATGSMLSILCSPALLGRVLGPTGEPIDGKGAIPGGIKYPAMANPPSALSRPSIKQRIVTGVRAIDAFLAVGKGQRLGVFAGSGVGKSTFQGMIARNTSADVNVIALIGERGRELNDFIENNLGEEGLRRSVIIVATSDQSALCRLRGAYIAAAVAEYFRDRAMNVMLLFDSVTRFARAQREIALSTGEVPAQRGYTPSVFDILPKLLERSGASAKGSITAFYTVLVDGDDMDEPISDNVRGILDGHIVLSRRLASRGHYPAVSILESISRLAGDISGAETKKAVRAARRFIADYEESEDMINAGAYKEGSNSAIDLAIAKHGEIEAFLMQEANEKSTLAETLAGLAQISGIEIPDSERTALQ